MKIGTHASPHAYGVEQPHVTTADCGETRFKIKTILGRCTSFHLGIKSQKMVCGGDGCGGSKEWTLFVGPKDDVPDPGFRPEHDCTEPLLKRLGIERQMLDGRSLQEVFE